MWDLTFPNHKMALDSEINLFFHFPMDSKENNIKLKG